MEVSQPSALNNTVAKQKVERNTYTSGDKSSLSALILRVTINTGAPGRRALPPGQAEGGEPQRRSSLGPKRKAKEEKSKFKTRIDFDLLFFYIYLFIFMYSVRIKAVSGN